MVDQNSSETNPTPQTATPVVNGDPSSSVQNAGMDNSCSKEKENLEKKVKKLNKNIKSLNNDIDSLEKQITVLKDSVVSLDLNVVTYVGKIEQLSKDTANLNAEIRSLKNMRMMWKKEKDDLNKELTEAKGHQSVFNVLTTPYGCSIIIVLILALTIIALKKGFSVSKGDTNISVGDKK